MNTLLRIDELTELLAGLTIEEKVELLAELDELDARSQQNAISNFFPDTGNLRRELYPKQMEFFRAGTNFKLRLFMAANRVGKTFSAAYELTCHLTGDYPHWWEGKRYVNSNNWWVCGVDSKLIRSELQQTLLGPVGNFGTGMIPKGALDFDSLKEAKKADTPVGVFRVKHKSGTYSSVEFKSYESGREAFQSAKVNIWLDEEPPLSIFTECLLRTMSTGTGDKLSIMITFTPLKGLSETVLNFLEGDTYSDGQIKTKDQKPTNKYVVRCGWDDVPHLSAEEKAEELQNIPPWARDARTRGIPQMGAGAIYPLQWEEVSVKRFEIPKTWKKFAGMDVGSKTAVTWYAVSPDNGVIYCYHEYYREGELPSIHVQGMAPLGTWIPIAIDSAAHQRSQTDGERLFEMYNELGLQLHNADKSVETGLYLVWELLATHRLKFFDDLRYTKEEFLIYHKDEKGKVVKQRDHLMDTVRYAMMTGRDLATLPFVKINTNNRGVGQQFRPHHSIQR